jgi:uncharacterized protein with PIN domain
MPIASIYFHGELNDFLPPELQSTEFEVQFNGHETVKHIIETLGVPHPEIEVILINNNSVDFSFLPRSGDQIEVFPSTDGLVVTQIFGLKPVPLQNYRFVVDIHLGKLANYLRLLGFDTRYRNDYDDSEIAEISHKENRILLTRDHGLLKRSVVRYGYYVREKYPQEQLAEIVNRFDLTSSAKPFSRCANCNGVLIWVDKENILDRIESKTKKYYNEFSTCNSCDQIYWKGSHFNKMEKFFDLILKKTET